MIHHFRSAVFALISLALVLTPAMNASATQDATPEAECVTTTPEENAALVTMFWDEVVWASQGKIAEIVSPDEVHHWGTGEETTGFEAFTEAFAHVLRAFPDISFTVDLVAAEGDLAATAWTANGTQTGEWLGIAPTNAEVTFKGINIFRIDCGQIVESWGEANNLGLLAQIGSPDVPGFLADTATAMAPAAGAAATPCAEDSPESNLPLVERWTNEVWNAQNLDVLNEIASPDIVHHGGAFPDAHGVDEIVEGISRQLETFPDIALTIDETIADGDLVVVRWSGAGTNLGEFIGHAPTGATIPISGINLYHVSCGKIVESWSEINGLEILQASLGAAATPVP